nr:gamma-butyrobetaine dioxygenase-like [Lytechinus pictus]
MALSALRLTASRLASPINHALPSNWSRALVATATGSTWNGRLSFSTSTATRTCWSTNPGTYRPSKILTRTVQTQSAITTNEEIASIARNTSEDWFEITWKDGFQGQYPYVWLRDNCRCEKCYHQVCYQRSFLMANLDPEVKPVQEGLTDDGKVLKIKWSDDHDSIYPSEWLKLHRFDETDFDVVRKIKPVSWGSEWTIPSYSYEDFINNDKTLYDWMDSLVKYGLVMIKYAPASDGICQKVCDRVGYERFTCYGSDFRVENLFDSSSLAFTTNELGLHVDLPYYDYRPGVQLLHCIRQCEVKGGDSQFVDAKRVVDRLKAEDPESFETLTQVKLDFRLIGKDFIDTHLQQARPMIELTDDGEFKGLAYNDQVRSPYINIPVRQVKGVYKALKRFHTAMYRKDNFINYKLKEGEVVTFDNNRVMHGRSGYTVTFEDGKDKSRLLEGAFLDWDEIYSRIRLLDEGMNGTPKL